MKNIFIAILMSLAILPSMATQVNVRTKSTLPRGGARMPSIERVFADYEKGLITIGVKGYTGGIQVSIYDSQGNIIGYTISSIAKEGAVSLNLDILNEGGYSLKIVLDNATYYGKFYV